MRFKSSRQPKDYSNIVVTSLSPRSTLLFSSGDPLSIFFWKYLKISPLSASIGWFLIINLTVVIATSINGLLLSKNGYIGLLENYSWWLLQTIAVPATVFFFFWLPQGICDVLKGLAKNRVIRDLNDDKVHEDYVNFIKGFDTAISHWALFLCTFIFVLIYVLTFSLPNAATYITWSTSTHFLLYFTEFSWGIVALMVILVACRAIVSIYWFARLFGKFKIDIQILHPDKAGGLSALGNFSVQIGYLIGIYGFSVVLLSFSESVSTTGRFTAFEITPAVVIGGIIYLVLAPMAFFAPIGSAHSAMKNAKDNFLLQISNQIDDDMTQIQNMLQSDSKQLGSYIDKLDQLEKLYVLASRFPIWPFNNTNVVRFLSSTVSPLLLALLSSALNRVIDWIAP